MLTASALLLKAFAAGGVAALPLGPMGVWCAQRTLRHGRCAGLRAAAGMSLALGLWGVAVACGLNLLEVEFVGYAFWLRRGLGVVMMLTGLRGLRRQTPLTSDAPFGASIPGGFTAAFSGVAGNPLTLLTLTSVFALLDLGGAELDRVQALGLLTALVAGAMSLWFTLTGLLLRLQRRWGEAGADRVRRGLSGVLLLLGLGCLLSVT